MGLFSNLMWALTGDEKYTPAAKNRSKSYPVPLHGESNYQAAISKLAVGDLVYLEAEPENPFDKNAVAVTDSLRRTLGYLPRDSWLKRALIKEKKSCLARVHSIKGGGRAGSGNVGVVILVTIDEGHKIGMRQYSPGG